MGADGFADLKPLVDLTSMLRLPGRGRPAESPRPAPPVERSYSRFHKTWRAGTSYGPNLASNISMVLVG